MKTTQSDVRVLIWDFDGTLYKTNDELYREIREAEYKTIMLHTGWDHTRTVSEFNSYHLHKFSSATKTTAYLSGVSVAQAAVEMEDYFVRTKYLSKDTALINLFKSLRIYTHYILANGVVKKIKEALSVLGLPESQFRQIITAETVGVTKPDPAGFKLILNSTGLAPHSHLMIGDREKVDLLPAKSLGMKTCLVWSGQPGEIADYTIGSVYEIPKILTI